MHFMPTPHPDPCTCAGDIHRMTANHTLRDVQRALAAAAALAHDARRLEPTVADVAAVLEQAPTTDNIPTAASIGVDTVGGYHALRRRLTRLLGAASQRSDALASLGVQPPSGALLYGPSGNGKSCILASIAAECGWPVLSVKGSQLYGAYVGETEASVRELFRKARACAPSILLLDEIDSLGGSRGDVGSAEDGGGGSVSQRALSTLLNEMDGVGVAGPTLRSERARSTDDQPAPPRRVVLIGLTNRPEMVDAALLRPGRLEQLLYVSYPTKDEREEVLRAHARSLPLSPRVLLPRLAERTERFSCAALAALCREAALQALARHTRKPTRRRGADLEADTRRASDTTPSDESTGDDTDDGTDDDGGDNEDNKDSDDGEGGGNSDDSDENEDDGEPSLMRDGSQVALDHALTIRLIDLSRAARIVRRQQVLSPSAHAQMLQKFAAFARQ